MNWVFVRAGTSSGLLCGGFPLKRNERALTAFICDGWLSILTWFPKTRVPHVWVIAGARNNIGAPMYRCGNVNRRVETG